MIIIRCICTNCNFPPHLVFLLVNPWLRGVEGSREVVAWGQRHEAQDRKEKVLRGNVVLYFGLTTIVAKTIIVVIVTHLLDPCPDVVSYSYLFWKSLARSGEYSFSGAQTISQSLGKISELGAGGCSWGRKLWGYEAS